jgi:hypothetical protein
LVLYSTLWPGVVVAGVVAVTVVPVVEEVVVGVTTSLCAPVPTGYVADGAATPVREPVEATQDGPAVPEG